MGRYCITAANHTNPDNHCASRFKVWEYNEDQSVWSSLGNHSIKYIVDLLNSGHDVFSAKRTEKPEGGYSISKGARIEVELRIAKNETNYKISDMPGF
jgi:hypothetical protein